MLLHANNYEIRTIIYPKLKEKFYTAIKQKDNKLLLNIIWLFGRLRLYDNDIYIEIEKILTRTNDYEIIYYIFQSMSDDPKQIFYNKFIN